MQADRVSRRVWYNKRMAEIKAIFHKCEPPETGYWAEVPSLPGCVSEGATLEECKAMIRDAAEGWLESAWELAMRESAGPCCFRRSSPTEGPCSGGEARAYFSHLISPGSA